LIVQMYAATYGTKAAVARCGNLFGGGDFSLSRMIPGVISSALQGQRFVIRSDGNFVRDFLYVKDAAESYLLLGERLAEDTSISGEAFNFSLEQRLTVLDIVNITLGIMGRSELEPLIQNSACSEIREQHLDASKARERLDWAPAYELEDALRETVAWYEEQFKCGY
jgi:CDP-glucose 4,6-dehydratase